MSSTATRFVRRTPEGEDRERLTCADCGYIAYENPKIVTGSVVIVGGKVMLCRRAIEPRRGFWTIPAGYMELNETVEEAAMREAREEACADLALDGILAVYSIARIGQVQVLFRDRLASPGFAPGPESLEVRLFDWEEIPWDDLAFPSVHWVLKAWREIGDGPIGAPRGNPAEDHRGTGGLAEGARGPGPCPRCCPPGCACPSPPRARRPRPRQPSPCPARR